MLSSIEPKLDVHLFVDFCVFPHSYLFSAKNCFEDQKNPNFSKTGKAQKSTNNRKSSSGLFEENVDLSRIYIHVRNLLLNFLTSNCVLGLLCTNKISWKPHIIH